MTFYKVTRSKSSTVVEVKGHADYDDKGYDIVCAGISIATLMTANLIDRLNYKLTVLDLIAEDGYFRLEVKNNDRVLNEIVNNLEDTLDDLWEQYPRYIKKN